MIPAAPKSDPQTWLVTGGCGFIGCNFVRSSLRANPGLRLINLDKLTYAGSLENLADVEGDERYQFVRGDICDAGLVRELLSQWQPDALVHLAAESHVDRSISAPAAFIQTNIVGTFTLIEAARDYISQLAEPRQAKFRFVHVSTDEVYGPAGWEQPPMPESAPYAPSSPYSASKASSDHLVMAAHVTYGFPALITHGSNTFGPYQFPEKFLPVVIMNALAGEPIPIYGDGRNERDWLSVDDHCEGLRAVVERGRVGQSYNIATGESRSNIEMANLVCGLVDELRPAAAPSSRLLQLVTDRPGHDRRYAVAVDKIRGELGWEAKADLQDMLRSTIEWYIENASWCGNRSRG